jgi:hypothetical protein
LWTSGRASEVIHLVVKVGDPWNGVATALIAIIGSYLCGTAILWTQRV